MGRPILPSTSSESAIQSNEGEYGYIRSRKLGRTLLVQYYTCRSNIPCAKVIGYIPSFETTESHEFSHLCQVEYYRLTTLVERIPDADKENIRRVVIIETNTRFKMSFPLVHFA
jgi:hypothetical protein